MGRQFCLRLLFHCVLVDSSFSYTLLFFLAFHCVVFTGILRSVCETHRSDIFIRCSGDLLSATDWQYNLLPRRSIALHTTLQLAWLNFSTRYAVLFDKKQVFFSFSLFLFCELFVFLGFEDIKVILKIFLGGLVSSAFYLCDTHPCGSVCIIWVYFSIVGVSLLLFCIVFSVSFCFHSSIL